MIDPVSDQPVEVAMHSPLPWSVDDGHGDCPVIRDRGSKAIALIQGGAFREQAFIDDANAALIVQSVNRAQQYEAMAEALGVIFAISSQRTEFKTLEALDILLDHIHEHTAAALLATPKDKP